MAYYIMNNIVFFTDIKSLCRPIADSANKHMLEVIYTPSINVVTDL